MRREGDGGDTIGQPGLSDEDRDRMRQLQRHRRARLAKLIVVLVILVYLIAFVLENRTREHIHFVFFSRNSRLIWIMIACAVLGGIVGFLVGRPGKMFRFRDGEHRD